MNTSFLFLLVSAGIFRYLAFQGSTVFRARVRGLAPRNVASHHMRVLFEEFPERIRDFRAQALPYAALVLLFDTLSCFTFVAALWFFPPDAMADFSRRALQYGSVLVVGAAFVVDFFQFCRILYISFFGLAAPRADAD